MIIPSRLTIAAYVAITALLLLAPVFPAVIWIVFAMDAALALLVWFEGRHILSPDWVTVEREFASRLSLGDANDVKLVVRNVGPVPLEMTIRDIVPEGLRADLDTFGPLPYAPDECREFGYQVRPAQRGNYPYRSVAARIQRPAGWAVRIVRLPVAADARVYPNINELRRYETLRQTRRLMDYGVHARRRLGKGSEFESLREYVARDDYKDVNWAATARRGFPITQLYQIERSQNIMIVIDSGRMMSTRVGELTKFDHAVNAGLLLCHAAKRAGDKVGLTVFSDRVKTFIPVGSGQKQMSRIIEALYPPRPDGFFVDYRALTQCLRLRNRKRGLVVVFTDFADADSGRELLRELGRLSATHAVLCVSVADGQLQRIRQEAPRTETAAYEKVAALELLDERDGILRALTRQGVHVLDVASDRITTAALNRFLELRQRLFG